MAFRLCFLTSEGAWPLLPAIPESCSNRNLGPQHVCPHGCWGLCISLPKSSACSPQEQSSKYFRLQKARGPPAFHRGH